MANYKKDFLDTVTQQISCKPFRSILEKELEDHIEDRMDDYMAEGLSFNQAEEQAVKAMGDPVAIGTQLNTIHQVQRTPALTVSALLLLTLGFGLSLYFQWTPEQSANGFLYYLPGLMVLVGVVWKGYPLTVRYAHLLLPLCGVCLAIHILLSILCRLENELFCRFAPLPGFDSAHLASAEKRKQPPSFDSDAVRHRSLMLYNLWLYAGSGWQPCFSGFCRLHNRNSSGYDSPGLFFPAWYGFFPIQTLPETAVFSCSGLSAPDWVFVYRLPLSENYVPGICQSRCPHPLHLGRHLQQRLNPPALIPHPSHQRAFLNHGRNDGLWNRGLVFRPEKSFTDRRLRHPLHRRRGKRI